jgi:hypothetical protein
MTNASLWLPILHAGRHIIWSPNFRNSMKIFALARFSGIAVPILLAGCGSPYSTIDDSCLVDLAPISVRTTVVSVGDTVTFEASLGPAECLPAGVEPVEWRWSSSDTLIATIDSVAGVAQGVRPGIAVIQVSHVRQPSVASATGLRVTAP